MLPVAEQQARRFAKPKTEEEVAKARKASIPKKTLADTKYCVRLWNEWKGQRNSTNMAEVVPEGLVDMAVVSLQHWLSRFVLEVRKKDGSEYPANMLHHLCCGIMRHLRLNGRPELDFFKDPTFSDFRATLYRLRDETDPVCWYRIETSTSRATHRGGGATVEHRTAWTPHPASPCGHCLLHVWHLFRTAEWAWTQSASLPPFSD